MGSEIGEKSMILTEKALKFSLNSLIHILLCIGPPCIFKLLKEHRELRQQVSGILIDSY